MTGRLVSFAAALLLLCAAPALAAPKLKGKTNGATSARSSADKGKRSSEEAEASRAREAASPGAEEPVKSAGAPLLEATDTSSVKVKEDKEGVKTYKFDTVEVEGRLKSPQVIYFLRRVRAEFDAGALGHRSFLGELSDSRRSAALR